MSNDYFNNTTAIGKNTKARSADINTKFDAVAAGFDKLPAKTNMEQGKVTYAPAGGSANTYTAAMPAALTAYAAGQHFRIQIPAGETNTGASTLNVDGLGARAIKRVDGTDVEAGDLTAGDIVDLVYNGTSMVMLGTYRSHMAGMASNLAADLAFSGNPTFSGNPAFTGSPDFSQADNKATIRQDLGVKIGTDVQAYDAGLLSIAGLTTGADKMIYTTGHDTYAVADLTAAGRALLDDANASAQRATLGLTIGTNVQAYNSKLQSLSGLTGAADRLPYLSGASTFALATLTSFGRSLIDDADASAARGTLGLGDAATRTVQTSDTDNTSGRVMLVGAGGLLSDGDVITDFSTIPSFSQFIAGGGISVTADAPPDNGAYRPGLVAHRNSSSRTSVMMFTDSGAALRNYTAGVPDADWRQVITDAGGQTINGNLTLSDTIADVGMTISAYRNGANYNNAGIVFDSPRNSTADGATHVGRAYIGSLGRSDVDDPLFWVATRSASASNFADDSQIKSWNGAGMRLSYDVQFWRNNTLLLDVDDTRTYVPTKLGVGTSSPTVELEVRGQITAGGVPVGSTAKFASRNDDQAAGGYTATEAHASYNGSSISSNVQRAANSAYNFFQAYSGNWGDLEFKLRGDGNGTCDGSWTGGGADYAEYFEWADGNPNGETRTGLSVVLDGDKIRPAQLGECPFGVISANPSVVGDGDIDRWKGKYLKDDFGAYIWEDYEAVSWTETVTETETVQEQATKDEEITREVIEVVDGKAVRKTVTETRQVPLFDEFPLVDEQGNPVMEQVQIGMTDPVLDAEGNEVEPAQPIYEERQVIHRAPRMIEVQKQTTKEEKHSYAADEVPEGVTVPADATRVTQKRRKLNPEYDPAAEYIPRADRPEWDMVGLMGKLRIRKGQPTSTRWIKMRDVSAEVEEWLVR